MQAKLDCIPCLVKQALKTSRLAGHAEKQQEKALRNVLAFLEQADWSQTPPSLSGKVQLIVERLNPAVKDPYAALKKQSNELLLKEIPRLRETIRGPDGFDRAMRIAIAGNIIDFAARSDFDVFKDIDRVLVQELALDDSEALLERLREAKTLIYLADNAGEIVLDRLLIEHIIENINPELNITVIVKAVPAINDAMKADAEASGLIGILGVSIDTVTSITASGEDEREKKEFREKIKSADVVISKGQANFEVLSNVPGIFFLLLTKCPVLAKDVGVTINSAVCYLSR
ncbi:MAG: DUF89 domain-containing protein [Candidatus Odinarchaeota archaeon]